LCENSGIESQDPSGIDVWMSPHDFAVSAPTGGRVYDVEAWVRLESGTSGYVELRLDENLSDGGTVDPEPTSKIVPTKEWMNLSLPQAVPGGLSSLAPALHFQVSSRTCIDVDDFTLVAK
jgi:hypothetical protein